MTPEQKAAKRAQDAAYYAANKERIKARTNQYYHENKDKCLAGQRDRYERNKEKVLKTNRAWADSNRDKMRTYHAEYVKRNRAKWTAQTAIYRSKKKGSTPVWADINAIKEVYEAARAWNEMWPEDRVDVDHIVPLQSKLVCGLHTHHNLRIIRATDNKKKSNQFWPDMP